MPSLTTRTIGLIAISLTGTRQTHEREASPIIGANRESQSTASNLTNIRATPADVGTQSLPPPQLPQLVATQHVPVSAHDNSTKRLIVVLSQASLEIFRASGHSNANPMSMNGMRAGRIGAVSKEDKFTLLNSDEHIGVMRKMGRDISEARPDITHQVSTIQASWLEDTELIGPIVPPHTPRLSYQQSRSPADLHFHSL